MDYEEDVVDVENIVERYLYNDLSDKLEGTFKIMQLARNPQNLKFLVVNERLISRLNGILKETDGKSSIDLMVNILYVFYSFSHFTQFHSLILQNEISGNVLKTIKYEIDKRFEVLKETRKNKTDPKIDSVILKQEKLLYVCFHILLNIAEDANIEAELINGNIVQYLCKMLDRDNDDLLIVVITFIKKLTMNAKCLEELVHANIAQKLIRLVPHSNDSLLNIVLKLLYNLAFYPLARNQIQEKFSAFVELLKSQLHLEIVIKILYQLSMDANNRVVFESIEVATLVFLTELVIEFPENYVGKELIGLMINVATRQKVARKISANNSIQRIMDRVSRTHDHLLAKLLKNLSNLDKLRSLFKPIIPSIVSMCLKSDDIHIQAAMLGIIGNLSLKEFSYFAVLKQYTIVQFLSRHLNIHDDLVLESVIATNTLCSDENCAEYMAKYGVIDVLCALYMESKYDEELLGQVLFAIYNFCTYDSSRVFVLQQPMIVDSLIEFYFGENVALHRVSDALMDVFMEHSEEWRQVIKKKKFDKYNQDWKALGNQVAAYE